MQKLVLWDIDGTILSDGKIGHDAYSWAIKKFLNIQEVNTIKKSGKTDIIIFREMLLANSYSEEKINNQVVGEVMNYYLDYFKKKYPKSNKPFLYTHAKEIIEKIDTSTNLFQSLLTGNIKEVAMLKLNKFDLDQYLKIGAFGDDSSNRTELAKLAVKRSKEFYGIDFKDEKIFVVGDTVRDIDCGKAINVTTVGVATGTTTHKELTNAGADYAIDNLEELIEILDNR